MKSELGLRPIYHRDELRHICFVNSGVSYGTSDL